MCKTYDKNPVIINPAFIHLGLIAVTDKDLLSPSHPLVFFSYFFYPPHSLSVCLSFTHLSVTGTYYLSLPIWDGVA